MIFTVTPLEYFFLGVGSWVTTRGVLFESRLGSATLGCFEIRAGCCCIGLDDVDVDDEEAEEVDETDDGGEGRLTMGVSVTRGTETAALLDGTGRIGAGAMALHLTLVDDPTEPQSESFEEPVLEEGVCCTAGRTSEMGFVTAAFSSLTRIATLPSSFSQAFAR